MFKKAFLLSLASQAVAFSYTLQSAPKKLSIIPDKMKDWSYNSRFWIDGKMTAYREDPNNSSSNFIIHITNDYRTRSPDQYVSNISAPASATNVSGYPNSLPEQSSPTINLAQLYPINGTVFPPNVTGLYDDGAPIWQTVSKSGVTFKNSGWLFNVFRLSETSNPANGGPKFIGFAHTEWTWGNCIYKWIGVRYSNDSLGWTYAAPIITHDTMVHACAPYVNATSPGWPGTGDMAGVWDPIHKRWVIIAQEGGGPLVMSVSDDPYAAPGTWRKVDPVNNLTLPGLIGADSSGNTPSLAHPDLKSAQGSNPSIIRDAKAGNWRMLWAIWGGGGIYASTSSDLVRWSTPTSVNISVDGVARIPGYPSLIGDGGDTVTSDGTAMLYWPDGTRENHYRVLWGAPIVFG